MLAIGPGSYPAFVPGTTCAQFFRADFPGGRHEPADAYRHSLATTTVAYTLSPRCVDRVTAAMERGGQGSRARAMDAHDDRLGAHIGATAGSWDAMQRAVLAAVKQGAADVASPDHITWLAPAAWPDRLY